MGQEQGKLLNDDDVRKADIAKMDAEMSRKMGRGVDWNRTQHRLLFFSTSSLFLLLRLSSLVSPLSDSCESHGAVKVLIRGARSTGKSCLFQRLQGGSFADEYTPTPRIAVAHIHWSYKSASHAVSLRSLLAALF